MPIRVVPIDTMSAVKQNKIGVRPETYRKYKRIAKQTRRTIAETADVIADEYLKRPSVEVKASAPEMAQVSESTTCCLESMCNGANPLFAE